MKVPKSMGDNCKTWDEPERRLHEAALLRVIIFLGEVLEMHIPDNYLSPATCAALGAVMVPVWAIAVKKV
jgi:hypothetical protein